MTAYNIHFASTITVSGSNNVYSSVVSLAIRATDFPIRIIEMTVEGAFSQSGSGVQNPGPVAVTRFESSTLSGGTGMTPISARDGSEPAAATVRGQPSTLNTGTGAFSKTGSAVSISGTGKEMFQLNRSSTDKRWQPPTEIVIAPGSVLLVKIPPSHASEPTFNVYLLYFDIWFDEERVSRSI